MGPELAIVVGVCQKSLMFDVSVWVLNCLFDHCQSFLLFNRWRAVLVRILSLFHAASSASYQFLYCRSEIYVCTLLVGCYQAGFLCCFYTVDTACFSFMINDFCARRGCRNYDLIGIRAMSTVIESGDT